INHRVVIGGLEYDSADVLSGDGAKVVIGAVWIFSGLELPTIVTVHNQNAGRAADLRAINSGGLALATSANDGNFIIFLGSFSKAAVGVALNTRTQCNRSAEGDSV